MASREQHLTRLLSSAGVVTAGKLVGSLSTLGERVIVGRLLDPSAYGEVTIGLALLSFSTTLGLLGYSQGVPRYVSRFESDRDVRGVWVTGMLVAGGLTLAIAAVLYLNVGWVTSTFLQTDATGMVALFVLALPFVVGMNVSVGAIRGFGNTMYKAYAQDLIYPLTRIALLAALLWVGFDVLAAGYAYLAGAALAFVVSLVLLNRLISLPGAYRTHVKEISAFSMPVVVSSFLATLLTRTDTLMLGYFWGSTEAGLYGAAYPLAGSMLIVISSFGFLYLPLASRLDAADEREEIDHIYKTTTKWIYVLTFPALLTFVVFPEDVVGIFFGQEYVSASIALVVLSVGFFSNAVGGRNRETISALGVTKYLLVTNGVAFGANVVLNLVLIPRYGFVGAAVASAVSYVGLNALACWVLWRGFDISPFSRWSTRTFVALPVALLPPAYLLSEFVSLTVVTLLPFLVVVGLLGIAVVAVTGSLQPEDAVVLSFVEDATGVRVPLIRRYLPEEEAGEWED